MVKTYAIRFDPEEAKLLGKTDAAIVQKLRELLAWKEKKGTPAKKDLHGLSYFRIPFTAPSQFMSWTRVIPYSEITIRRAMARLKRLKVVVSTNLMNIHHYDKTNWYALNEVELFQLKRRGGRVRITNIWKRVGW